MRKLKRSLAVLLAVLVLITALPLTAFADEAAESPPVDTAASIDETVKDEVSVLPEDDSGTVNVSSLPPSPEPSAEPDADEKFDGTEDSTASEPDSVPAPDASAAPTPIPSPINLEYEYLPESETGGIYVFPAPYGGDLTQVYSAEHPAWDIAGDTGSPVVSVDDGVVTQVQIWDGSEDATGTMSYGNMVKIEHPDGKTTLYAHLSEINVSEGDAVIRGQRIGRMGSSGNASGTHLHFEVRLWTDERVDPTLVIDYGIRPLALPNYQWDEVYSVCNNPTGTKTVSDWGVTRDEVIAELTAHENDKFYLTTPYEGYDNQSPNGDTGYNGSAGLNCAGFVSYVLRKCGLDAGTADLNTHSAVPAASVQGLMTKPTSAGWETYWSGSYLKYELLGGASNYANWIENGDIRSYAFQTKADMLSSGKLEKGDIILMLPQGGIGDTHIAFFWGNTSSEDKMWHSSTHPGSGNQISQIVPKSSPAYYVVIKYGEDAYDITLTKTSANVKITAGNPNYSLAGAVYNVYTRNATPGHDYSKDPVQATFTTDAGGKANLSKKLKDGDYAVIEVTAPKGYVLDPITHFVNISGGNTTLNVVDDPSAISLTVVKKDAGTGTSAPQGNASLKGAVYRVTYSENGADKSVDITTDANGKANLKGVPLGTVKVQEVKAPVGYKLDNTVHTYTVTPDKVTSAVYTLELDDFREQVFLNKIKVIKKAEMVGAPDILEPGAKFEVYLKSAGSYANAKATERDIITTGSDGTATTKLLPYGTYTVHQIAGGAGRKFAADFDVVINADSSTHAPYEVNLRNELKPGTVNIVKTSDDGVIAGLKFKITRNIDNWSQTVTTGADGQISVGNLPIYSDVAGSQKIRYTITEVNTPDRYVQPASQTVTLTEGQTTEVRFRNKLQSIGTTAKFDDGTKISDPVSKVRIVDTVSYSSLIPGKTYTLSGVLMDKSTGKELLVGGKTVTATKDFTPTAVNGTVDITFVLDARTLKGQKMVVFETLTTGGNPVAVHKDINDAGQTVEFTNPALDSVATVGGQKSAVATDTYTINEVVTYSGLIPGNYYRLEGRLMNKATGKELIIGGKSVTATKDITPTAASGSVTLSFTFDAREFKADTDVVVFDVLYGQVIDGSSTALEPIAKHENINDADQTIKVLPLHGSLQIVKVDHDGTTPLEGAKYQITDVDGKVVTTQTTDKNGKIVVGNLLYGSYHYQEIEAPKGYDLDSTIYDFAVGHDGQIITVTRENTPSVGSISVCKVNSAGTPMSGVPFLLEFSVDDGASWKPVIARPAGSRVSIGGCDSSGLKDGVLVTGNDGIAAFTGLQIDNQIVTIRYRLTEIATRDGNTLMPTVLYDGSLPDANGSTEITDIKITAVNNRNLELPNSGGSGFPVSSVGAVLIFVGLLFCVCSIRLLRKAR